MTYLKNMGEIRFQHFWDKSIFSWKNVSISDIHDDQNPLKSWSLIINVLISDTT
jgi:hypothetical protein